LEDFLSLFCPIFIGLFVSKIIGLYYIAAVVC